MPSLNDVVADNVRGERSKRRWTQKQLGDLINVSDGTISDLESGRRKIGVDDLLKLCGAFDVPLSKLLDGADPADIRRLGL
jgi:transcriptional regulator with XRE-family HTH domain